MKAATLWMWTPAVFLVATVAFGAWRVHVALDDPHHAAVENPYQSGERWDEHQAALATSLALGYQTSLEMIAPGQLELRIQDSQGAAVSNLVGELRGFHNGYPKAIETVRWEEQEPGVYRATVEASRPGLWKWHAKEDDGPWLEDFKLHISAP